MNIGQVASFSGVSAKMIRYYEKTGLIPEAQRSAAGYRRYTRQDADTLRFIRRSRDLGFTVEQISELLLLWQDRQRSSADVKTVALSHVAVLEAKVAELQAMADTLRALARSCQGNERPDCPIIKDLAEAGGTRHASTRSPPVRRALKFGLDTPAASQRRRTDPQA